MFINLNCKSQYSILQSTMTVKDIIYGAKNLGQTAVAITDLATATSFWDGYNLAREAKIKFIAGIEFYFRHNQKDNDERFKHLILIAKNQIGYKNLLTLHALGFDNIEQLGKKSYSCLDYKLIEQYSEGLICLTSGGNGVISQLIVNDKLKIEENILKLKSIFGDNLGLEVQPHYLKKTIENSYSNKFDQQLINHQMIKLGEKYNIRVVATSNAMYLNKEDSDLHNVLLAISSGQSIYSNYRPKYDLPEFYMKTEKEVFDFFNRSYPSSAQSIIDNSKYFADLCEEPEWINPKFSNPSGKELPEFPVKDEICYSDFLSWLELQSDLIKGLKEDQQYLRYRCDIGLKEYWDSGKLKSASLEVYKNRIEEELDVLEYHGFSSYMLVTSDFLKYGRKLNPLAVGPGRGSVGGSFVAYLLDIHKADPLKYDLIFARFHNKEKKFFPDCDNDFGDSIRQDVISYLSEKYGHDCVAHVSNINKITPKVYVRDLCRALELGGSRELAIDFGNKIANSIPKEIHSIDQALNDAPLFGEWCKRFPELIKYKKLDNQLRASSTHAAGLIVSKRSLIGLVPCRKDKDGSMAIEYSKDPCEENGLVKIDMLGLKTLDIINNTYSLIKQSGLDKPNFKVEECDEKAYDLISSGDTFGVFQFGTSGGTIDLCKKIKPKNIEELSMINSLARPSSKEIRAPFVKARDLNKSTTLLHPKLQRSLGSTFGFSIYEESLMFLAFDIANWNLNEADVLRKLTKEKGKNPAKAEKIKQKFILDSVKNGIDENIATRIWTEIIEYYAKYGFNKSHSVLYSMTSYHTAYLKAHYPVQFLLSNLMSEDDSNALNADSNISQIKEEIRKSGIEILKPSLNESERNYKIINNKMLTGFASMKRLQDKAIEEIIEKRPFTSLQDFVQRIDQSKVQLPTVQALIACGCFDGFGHSRKSLFLFFKDFRDKLQRFSKKKNGSFEYVFPNDDWTLSEKYALEVEYMGEAFICNQTEAYSHFYGNVYTPVLTKLLNFEEKAKVESMRAIIKDIFTFPVKKEGSKMLGREMAKLTLLDKDLNRFSATIFPDLLDNLKSRKITLEPELGIFFEGTINYYQDEFGVIIDSVYNISQPPSLPKDRKSTKLIKDFKENKPESDNSLVNDLLDFIS